MGICEAIAATWRRWVDRDIGPTVHAAQFRRTAPKAYDGRAKFRTRDGDGAWIERDVTGQDVIVVDDPAPQISEETAARVRATQITGIR